MNRPKFVKIGQYDLKKMRQGNQTRLKNVYCVIGLIITLE